MKRYLSCELDFETFKVECSGVNMNAWRNFRGDTWKNEINVRDFIQNNNGVYSIGKL